MVVGVRVPEALDRRAVPLSDEDVGGTREVPGARVDNLPEARAMRAPLTTSWVLVLARVRPDLHACSACRDELLSKVVLGT